MAAIPLSRRTAERERGAVLLLSFLALIVLIVVIVQLNLSSEVNVRVARNELLATQLDYAARGAFEQAKSLLVTDLRDESLDAGQGGEGGESPEGGGDPAGGAGGGGMGGGGGGGEDDASQAPNDSLKDPWGDASQSQLQLGEVEARMRIIDEDRKFNLLTIVARDEDFREASKARAVTLLDTFREGTSHDLSRGEASDIVDEFQNWLKGERGNTFPNPKPLIAKEEGTRFQESDTRFAEEDSEPIIFPLGLDELLMIDGMTEELLHGFIEDDRFVPGLEDVVTVFSNLAFDAETYQLVAGGGEEEGEEASAPGAGGKDGQGGGGGQSGKSGGSGGGSGNFQNPFGAGGGGGGGKDDEGGEEKGAGAGEDPEEAEGPPQDSAGQLEATETSQGRVNINTAPLAVLRVLLPEEELPYAILEKIDEFRRTAFDQDLLEEAQRRGYGEKESGQSGSKDQKEKDDSSSPFGSDSEDLEALADDFSFRDPNEVIGKVQDYFETNFELGDEVQSSLAKLIAVKSHVFTIVIELRARQSQGRGGSMFDPREAPPPPDGMYRAVVWRRKDGDKFQVIPIVPLHASRGVLPPDTEDYRKRYPFGF